MLNLANDAKIAALQEQLRLALPDLPADAWQDPATFHVTLIYADSATGDNLAGIGLRLEGQAGIRITSSALGVFENGEERALHLVVEPNAALIDLQRSLREEFEKRELPLSEYSAPDAYTPHITLAYLPAGVEPPAISVSVDTVSERVDFSRPDYEIALSIPLLTAPAGFGPNLDPALLRSSNSLEVAVPFEGHQFVRYARRALSEFLTANDVTADEWVDEADWRLTLAQIDGVTPADAARFVRQTAYDGRKIDLAANGYVAAGDGIFLRVEENDGLKGLRTSAALDAQTLGRNAVVGPAGILLCRVSAPVDVSLAPSMPYPLVATTVCARYNGEDVQRWTLRGVSSAQAGELRNWKFVAEKSVARAISFTPQALRGSVLSVWLPVALEAISVSDAFDVATEVLAGNLTLRAFPETRAQFIEEVRQLIGEAQASELGKRHFSSRMRTVLRKLGLQAFGEGIRTGNPDHESFSKDELEIYKVWVVQSNDYVAKLAAEIFGQGITENEVRVRSEMWANKSLDDIFHAGLRIGAPEQLATWRFDPTNEHCEDCRDRHGQTLTLDEWGQLGYPRDSRLECGGWFCGCSLFDPETGDEIGWDR
jgi:2'-5' RNA ligase